MNELDDVAEWYSSTEGVHARVLEASWKSIQPYCRGTACLELGSADGGLTGSLLTHFSVVTAVDGASPACERLADRYADREDLKVICSRFESLKL